MEIAFASPHGSAMIVDCTREHALKRVSYVVGHQRKSACSACRTATGPMQVIALVTRTGRRWQIAVCTMDRAIHDATVDVRAPHRTTVSTV